MSVWYAGFLCNRHRDELISTLSRAIARNDLGDIVPVMQVERRAGRQFYLFLGINTEIPGVWPSAADALTRPGLLPNNRLGPFTQDQIRGMCSGDIDVHRYASALRYWRAPAEPYDDPFAGDEPIEEAETRQEQIMSATQRYDQLLLWLSAAGSGSWQSFRAAFDDLGLSTVSSTARRAGRRLRLLGHLELSPDGSRWWATPPAVVRVDWSQDETYTLCGARDSTLLATLDRMAEVEVLPQHGLAPATVRIRAINGGALVDSLPRWGDDERMEVIASTAAFATHLPSLEEWKASLQPISIHPEMFELKRFDGERFVDAPFDGESGFYEFSPMSGTRGGTNRPHYNLFYDRRSSSWLRGDWYGLRFLALYECGEPSRVLYNPALARLAVPVVWRWPEIYERALVLASGKLPVRQGSWLVYESVAQQSAEALRLKLGLEMEEFV